MSRKLKAITFVAVTVRFSLRRRCSAKPPLHSRFKIIAIDWTQSQRMRLFGRACADRTHLEFRCSSCLLDFWQLVRSQWALLLQALPYSFRAQLNRLCLYSLGRARCCWLVRLRKGSIYFRMLESLQQLSLQGGLSFRSH